MIRAFALVFSMLAAPLGAEPICEMRGAEPVAVNEAAKAAFLKGDFAGFAEVATEIMGDKRSQLDKPLGQMAVLFPNGFESCQTILQRREVGGMVQEVITFNIKGQDFPMSLYLLTIPIRGEMKIGFLNFNTTLSDVLESLY